MSLKQVLGVFEEFGREKVNGIPFDACADSRICVLMHTLSPPRRPVGQLMILNDCAARSSPRDPGRALFARLSDPYWKPTTARRVFSLHL